MRDVNVTRLDVNAIAALRSRIVETVNNTQPARWRPAVEPRTAGHGSLVVSARPAYRLRSGRRQPHIESTHIRVELDSAACAGSPFIALAGILICGMSRVTVPA